MFKLAVISDCGQYRYRLVREWSCDSPRITWVMLNPSTADAKEDDPTIRRCIGFAQRWGFGGINVCNLFALRATDPKELKKASDPLGPENESILQDIAAPVVVAWGGNIPNTLQADHLARILRNKAKRQRHSWWCLGKTKWGEPRHPLMLSYSVNRQNWPQPIRKP